jgi:hypothetical protein
MVADWLGWGGLSPDAQFGAICGGAAGLGVAMTLRAMFGGLTLRRSAPKKNKKKRKTKAKAKSGRR